MLISEAAFCSVAAIAQQVPGIFIRVHTPSGEPVQGAMVRIERNGGVSFEMTTNTEGKLDIPSLAQGEYIISVTREGFQRLAQALIIQDVRQQVEIDFSLLTKLVRNDNVDVVADVDPVAAAGVSSGVVELKSSQVTLLPTKPATVADTLPLVPGVNRDANGEIRISGEGEQRSALIVNASDATDPASGRFGVTVPMGSVETIDIFRTPFLPQYGRFTSGVVVVQTKRGGEKWRYSLREPIPDFRVRSGRIRGLRDATPKISIGGPLVRNILYFAQSADYSLEKKQVRTLSFPRNESKVESVNSFTQFDYVLSPDHYVTSTIHFSPQHTNFVDPQYFNPQPVTPSSRRFQRAWTLIDHSNGAAGVLESSLSQQVFSERIGSQGDANMVLTPTGNLGNYFSRQNRNSSRLEWMETFSHQINNHGSHDLKFGSVIARTSTSGAVSFRPVEIWDENRRLIQKIEFTAGSPFDHSDVEHALFAQDHWTVDSKLALDGGLRVEHQTKTSTWRMAPRIAAAWMPASGDELVIHGGFGVFYDRVPLAVYSFLQYPEQVITSFDSSGQIAGKPRHFVNIIEAQIGKRFRMLKSRQKSGNFAPYSQTWTLEVERRFSKLVHLRAGYQASSSGGGIVVTPRTFSSAGAIELEGNGRSLYRQLEVTAKMSWSEGQQMLFSYVLSKARGDLNAFNSYLSNYPMVPLHPNVFSNLPGDLPSRFISWGFLNLPWKLRLAPTMEYRTGAPYAVLNAARNYVGIPYDDKTRLRNYFSLDVRVSKDVKAFHKYRARLSVSGLNLTNHFNSLDVHANVADPQFGVLFGHYKRRYRGDFELLF